MKPGYIFSAVFVVALFMALGLPQLVAVPPAYAESVADTTAGQQVDAQNAASMSLAAAAAPTAVSPPAGFDSAGALSPTAAPASSIPLTSVSRVAPELQSFIATVVNNRPGQVVGVYVPGVFALPILQQPAGDQNYISPFDGALTQYAPPSADGVVSLLAHNYLSGRVFFELQIGDEVVLVYGDGRTESYVVSTIDTYQALSPLDPYSDFIDETDSTATIQSFQDVYDRYYKDSGQLVFQTCIERNGELSWGRIFIVAQPY